MDKLDIQIIKEFFDAYNRKEWSLLAGVLSDQLCADYSTIGTGYDKENFIEKAKLTQLFDIQTTTLANLISYHDDGCSIVLFNAHHLNAYEEEPYFYPVVFGGKYEFVINDNTHLIEHISFVLQYHAENTYFLDGCNLSHTNIELLKNFDSEKQWKAIMRKESMVNDIVLLFYHCFDLHDTVMIDKLLDKNAILSNEKTYANGSIIGSAETITNYIKDVEDYYVMSQHSIRINNIEKDEYGYVVEAQLLSPQRLNTKKLMMSNKYHTFFEEIIQIKLNENFKITMVEHKKMSEIYNNGYHVLEV